MSRKYQPKPKTVYYPIDKNKLSEAIKENIIGGKPMTIAVLSRILGKDKSYINCTYHAHDGLPESIIKTIEKITHITYEIYAADSVSEETPDDIPNQVSENCEPQPIEEPNPINTMLDSLICLVKSIDERMGRIEQLLT